MYTCYVVVCQAFFLKILSRQGLVVNLLNKLGASPQLECWNSGILERWVLISGPTPSRRVLRPGG
jgi:hypothetical protein